MTPRAAQPDSTITLSGVSVAYGGRAVLQGVDLQITERRVGILGRNGSGKTTLLRVMAGLVAPTAGQVRVGGHDPNRDRKVMLGQVGILFQNPDHQILFPTVEEELAFGLLQMGLTQAGAAARVTDLLAAEGRAHWAKAPAASLSHGQRQYLCLMAILLMGPATLLLDEPFAALDLPTRARLSRRLARVAGRIITISHDPEAVADCDRVIWLDAGGVRADGPPPAVIPPFLAEMTRIGDVDADTDLSA